jgi:gas vesicle protein
MKEKAMPEGYDTPSEGRSNMVPFIVAGSAAGAAIGFFFATESGRRARTAFKDLASQDLPNKIDEARRAIEERSARWGDKGQRIANKVQGLMMLQRDRFIDAVQEGKQQFYKREGGVLHHLGQIDTHTSGISDTLHKTIDSLHNMVATTQSSIFDRVYEWGALGYGMISGVRSFWDNSAESDTEITGTGESRIKLVSDHAAAKNRSEKPSRMSDPSSDDEKPRRRGGAGGKTSMA